MTLYLDGTFNDGVSAASASHCQSLLVVEHASGVPTKTPVDFQLLMHHHLHHERSGGHHNLVAMYYFSVLA